MALSRWSNGDPPKIREYRKSWNVAANTAAKKMAILKTSFEFCSLNEWISRNPARLVRQKHNRNEDEEKERIPFTDEELTRMYQACETSYGKGEYECRYSWNGQDLEDFIYVSIYTGLRISDVSTFRADRLRESGECQIRTTSIAYWSTVLKLNGTACSACELFIRSRDHNRVGVQESLRRRIVHLFHLYEQSAFRHKVLFERLA
jgi:integrase